MESRMREGRNKLIDAFVQLVRHENNEPVVWCYPPDGLDEELRRSVPRFAFPFQEDFQSSNIDYFTFVLTALDGKFRFGFCRMSAGSESTLCLISSYPWFEIFYKMLNHLSDAQNSSSEKLQSLLEDLSEIDPSIPGKRSLTFKIPGTQQSVPFEYPNPNKLPSIPESRNLTEYYNAIDGHNMLVIFASMLFERRIIMTSRKLSRLTACVYGATSLMYPLNWQHIFIPVLPAHLLDYLSAPMPYLIGVHSSLLNSVRSVELDDAVIVDADKGVVHNVHGDLASLPSSVVSGLKKSLNLRRKDKHCCLTGDKLSRAFLNAMVTLIGGYRTSLVERDGRVAFDREMFEHSRGSSMQLFLQKILQSQSFEQFIEERVMFAKYRKGFSDIFEEAVEASEMKQRGSVKHKVNNMKAEKMFGDITKKVRKTSAKTFSSVKKKLEFKKNHDHFYEEGKAIQYPEEEASQVAALVPTLSVIQLSENASNNQITLVVSPASDLQVTPSILRRHHPTSSTSTMNRRHSFIMAKAEDNGEVMMGFDRGNVLKKFSFDDLTNQDAEEDAVTLSSCSNESCHDDENSKTLPDFADNRNQEITNLPSIQTETSQAEGSIGISAEPRPGITVPDESTSAEDSDEGHSEDDVVGEINRKANAKVNRLNKDPVVEFPSVRLLAKALQPTNTVKRKAIISVQELPNVKEIIQKIEASAKPHEIAQKALCRSQEVPHTTPYRPQEVVLTIPCKSQEEVLTALHKSPEVVVTAPCKSQEEEHTAKTDAGSSSSFVARQAAAYSLLDRKARTSLSRKQAIRVTSPRVKKPSTESDVVDGGDADVTKKNENRSSYLRQNSERYQGLLDLVKAERNSGLLEVNDPFENDYGCLLRVSTKSASMRQLNLIEQRQSASLKRSLPVSVAVRDNLQRSRTAIYEHANSDTETKAVARNNSTKSSFRNALYVPFQVKSATETVETDDSDDSTSEISITGIDCAEHPNEFARRLDYEILSSVSSASTELEQMSQSPALGPRNKSFKQSWSFDGVIVDKRDVLEMPPFPNEANYPGKLPGSSDEDSSSESSTVFDDHDLGATGPSKQFCTLERDDCNAVSVDSNV